MVPPSSHVLNSLLSQLEFHDHPPCLLAWHTASSPWSLSHFAILTWLTIILVTSISVHFLCTCPRAAECARRKPHRHIGCLTQLTSTNPVGAWCCLAGVPCLHCPFLPHSLRVLLHALYLLFTHPCLLLSATSFFTNQKWSDENFHVLSPPHLPPARVCAWAPGSLCVTFYLHLCRPFQGHCSIKFPFSFL